MFLRISCGLGAAIICAAIATSAQAAGDPNHAPDRSSFTTNEPTNVVTQPAPPVAPPGVQFDPPTAPPAFRYNAKGERVDAQGNVIPKNSPPN